MSASTDINTAARAQRDVALAANQAAIAAVLKHIAGASDAVRDAGHTQILALNAEGLRIQAAFIAQVAATPENQKIIAQMAAVTKEMTATASALAGATAWANEVTTLLGYGTQVITLAAGLAA